MKLNLYKLRGRFKGLLFISAIALIIGLLFYTQRIVNALRAESRSILAFYAELYASAATTETNSDLDFIFNQIIQRTNFPIIMTDSEDIPVAWQGIGSGGQNTRSTLPNCCHFSSRGWSRRANPEWLKNCCATGSTRSGATSW